MITYHPTSTAEGNHRFALEQEGENVLIVIGLTPNTGTDIEPDDMTKSIIRFMDAYGYDGFVILNISSERCDNSDHLSAEPDFQMHKKNLNVISKLNEKYDSSDILVCFGGGFNKRMYLQKFLVDIHNILSHHKRWLSIGGETGKTKYGHPRSPKSASLQLGLYEFDIEKYIERQCWFCKYFQDIDRPIFETYPWRWALVGNIVKEHSFGEQKEVRYGTKHFAPGTKVCCSKALWGDGYQRLAAIGAPRHGRKFIEIIIERKMVQNFRLKKIFNPSILQKMDIAHYSWWGNSDDDKMEILSYLEFLNNDKASE